MASSSRWIRSPPSVPSLRCLPRHGLSRPSSLTLLPYFAFIYSSRGHEPSELGEKYGRLGNTLGGSEYQRAICLSSSLSHVSGKLNQSSSNAIKSPSICADKSTLKFVKLSSPFSFITPVILRVSYTSFSTARSL